MGYSLSSVAEGSYLSDNVNVGGFHLPGIGPLMTLAFAAALVAGGPRLAEAADAPPPGVVVAPVVVKDVAPATHYIGHVLAIQSVKLVPRVTAYIDEVAVKQGSAVKAGQVLFRLQSTSYEAALQSAQASLQSARAAYQNAQLAYQRALRLGKTGAAAQATVDQALATRNQDQAAILSAQADVTQAQLNLSYCTITAPIAGRIGTATLTRGNLVTPNTAALTTINQLDPIRVVFSVSDADIVDAEQKSVEAQNGDLQGLKASLTLPNGKPYDQAGSIAFFDNQVDTQTGTVSVYADFANPHHLLLPGSYVSVQLRRAKPQLVPLVPVAAVQTDQHGSFVLTVGRDNKVKQQPVKLGHQIAQNDVVESGLRDGDRVIVDGLQKVKPGEVVKPTTAPSTAAAAGPPPVQVD